MSKPLSWQLNVFKEYGVTPDEAAEKSGGNQRKYNYALIKDIDCPVDEVTDWDLVTDFAVSQRRRRVCERIRLSTRTGARHLIGHSAADSIAKNIEIEALLRMRKCFFHARKEKIMAEEYPYLLCRGVRYRY